MISSVILSVLTVIEQFIPLLGTSSATATMIDNIINALTQLLPYIVNEISTVYQSVKNIIALLNTNGALTTDQQNALQQLDTQVDTAWNNLQASIDPDAPGGDPASKTS